MSLTVRLPSLSSVAGFHVVNATAWAVYGISTYLAILPTLPDGAHAPMLAIKAVRTAIGYAVSLALHAALLALIRRGVRRSTIVAVSLVACAVGGVVWLGAYWWMTEPMRAAPLATANWRTFPRTVLDHMLVLLAWTMGWMAARAWVEARAAELRMLRAQLEPHFVFNALNSLRASIPLELAEPRAFVDDFSSFLRHTLERSGEPLTSIEQEVDAVRSYLAIQERRYGGRLESQVHVAGDIGSIALPTLLIHTLVENAVKHGIASGAQPVRVRVDVRRVGRLARVEIVNNVGHRHVTESHSHTGGPDGLGLGLHSVREQLRQCFDGDARFELARRGDLVVARLEIHT